MTKKVKPSEAPLSQDEAKITSATQEEVLADLRRIAEADVEKVITRNYYRVHSRFAESAWNAHFGTFAEFKRQAGIILSRHQHSVERHIAKHASADRMRALTADKKGWEGKFLKPDNKRWQSVVVCSDVHDIDCDMFYRRVLLDAIARIQPEKVVLNGDIFDLPEFSKYTNDPRLFNPVERIQWVHKFLEDIREAAPDAELIFVEGNHEFRLLRHLSEATPALMTVLSDLHGLTIPALLGLTKYEVNFVARADLAAFNETSIKKELALNYVMLYDSLLFHHFPEGFQMGMPGANGHHHKHTVRAAYSPTYGPYEWHQTGAGHKRHATYCAGEKWSNGFLIANVDTHTRRTHFDYVDTTHDHCVMGGDWYIRQEGEERPDA